MPITGGKPAMKKPGELLIKTFSFNNRVAVIIIIIIIDMLKLYYVYYH